MHSEEPEESKDDQETSERTYRVYMGNIDSRVTEETLDGLFEEHGLIVSNILVKRGYAFADCKDQHTLDKAVELLNGYNLMGSQMNVEPSTMSRRRRNNTRVQISNLPSNVSREDVENLIASFGKVQRCELANGNGSSETVHVSYETEEQAQQAVEQLNKYSYHGAELQVDYLPQTNGRPPRGPGGAPGGTRPPRSSPGGGGGNGNGANSSTGPNNRGSGYPLRILVPSDFVGAIIGRRGQTIRQITTQCKARIDVHRDNNIGMIEKVISIFGQPENCTNACREILLVMQQEACATNRGYDEQDREVTLKMLADDRYCGRIIGKEGKVIKKIREDTDTKITVSNAQEVAAMYPDRVITIRGNIDSMCQAEGEISTKLRECHEKEMQAPMPPNMMMSNPMTGLPMLPPPSNLYNMPRGSPYSQQSPMDQSQGFPYNMGGYSGPGMGGQQGQQGGSNQPATDMCQVSVPNSAVGAIIGAGGSNIKQIIRDSNAFVTIEPKKDEIFQIEPKKDEDPDPAAERTVTIKGNPDAIWRASYYVYEKMKQEGFAGNEDVRLRTAIRVPRSMVGRVIGKGGKNVRDIQRMTGAMIKLPEDQAAQGEEVVVECYGSFMATQSAHSRIRALVQQQLLPGGPGGPGGAAGPGPGGPPGPVSGGPPMRGPGGGGGGERRGPPSERRREQQPQN